jgi:WD40 repeat protein
LHAAFSPDGKTLATGSFGAVSLWDVATGKLRWAERAGIVHRVAFPPDGRAVHAVCNPNRDGCTLLTLDPATGAERRRTAIRVPSWSSVVAEFSPDGRRLLVVCSDATSGARVLLFDSATGKDLTRVRIPAGKLRFTPGGKSLAVTSGYEARLFDLETGAEAEKPVGVPVACPIEMEFSPDEKRFVRRDSSGVKVLDAEKWTDLYPLDYTATAARFSPDGKMLAVTTGHGTVSLRDAVTGQPLSQSGDVFGSVEGLSFTPDGRRLIGRTSDRWVSWDLTPPAPAARPGLFAYDAVLSLDGKVAVLSNPDTPRAFIDPETGKVLRAFDPPETRDTVPLWFDAHGPGLFSDDGRRFVALRRWLGKEPPFREIELGLTAWDVATGKRVGTLSAWGVVPLTPLAVSPDGKAVIVRCSVPWLIDEWVGLWEPDTGRGRWAHPADFHLSFVTFTAGGTRVVLQAVPPAAIPGDGFAGLVFPRAPGPFIMLDAVTGKEVLRANGPKLEPQPFVPLPGGSVYTFPSARAISPDGRIAAVSDYDGTLYLWDLTTDRERARFAHPGPVHDLAFSPDGRTLAAASLAGPVLLYDLPGLGPEVSQK